jgi:hypothetical protein
LIFNKKKSKRGRAKKKKEELKRQKYCYHHQCYNSNLKETQKEGDLVTSRISGNKKECKVNHQIYI